MVKRDFRMMQLEIKQFLVYISEKTGVLRGYSSVSQEIE